MAVITIFRDPARLLPVREQLDGSAHDPAAESAETHALHSAWPVSQILQRLEAGQ